MYYFYATLLCGLSEKSYIIDLEDKQYKLSCSTDQESLMIFSSCYFKFKAIFLTFQFVKVRSLIEKCRQVDISLLHSSCRVCHYNECVMFEFNDISLYTKNDSTYSTIILEVVCSNYEIF